MFSIWIAIVWKDVISLTVRPKTAIPRLGLGVCLQCTTPSIHVSRHDHRNNILYSYCFARMRIMFVIAIDLLIYYWYNDDVVWLDWGQRVGSTLNWGLQNWGRTVLIKGVKFRFYSYWSNTGRSNEKSKRSKISQSWSPEQASLRLTTTFTRFRPLHSILHRNSFWRSGGVTSLIS